MAHSWTQQTANLFTSNTASGSSDPFPQQRVEHATRNSNSNLSPNDATTEKANRDSAVVDGPSTSTLSPTGRRYSGETGDEWDASKTPPSRFQQKKGSIYATPGSRDGHLDRYIERDAKYHEKLAEKGWGTGRGSKASN
ncbi:hypothetical protein BJ875DRAFT_438495 [Amylocarpus encephaloides]|uniref:Uncharacterized protein n=1 Tax=Amylocarpus encephaloides TaxID=45428 RepID=A0A9P7YQM1_9HELO|nr:hypothetical protein BJ875DRAFT_438495 [Amylocarpus encephaloides]